MTNSFIKAYHEAALKAGFVSDSDFMRAWRENPQRWSKIFSLRMNAINSMA